MGKLDLRPLYVTLRRRLIYGRCLRSQTPLIILRYHAVGDPSTVSRYISPDLSVSPERFRQQIRFLVHRFHPILPDDLVSVLSQGELSKPSVLITFDDGYLDNYDVALTILREEGAVAAFFITTQPLTSGLGLWTSELRQLVFRLSAGPSNLPPPAPAVIPKCPPERVKFQRRLTRWMASLSRNQREQTLDHLASLARVSRGEGLQNSFLTPDHLRLMRKAGMSIGAHTRSHPHLDRLNPIQYKEEIAGSRADLEKILGEPVRHFAYPNPGGRQKLCEVARKSVQEAGFLTAFTSIPKPITANTDPMVLPRIAVNRGEQEQLLFRLLAETS